eukprot:6357634-Alexandrium_andersonii.AAC.1
MRECKARKAPAAAEERQTGAIVAAVDTVRHRADRRSVVQPLLATAITATQRKLLRLALQVGSGNGRD